MHSLRRIIWSGIKRLLLTAVIPRGIFVHFLDILPILIKCIRGIIAVDDFICLDGAVL